MKTVARGFSRINTTVKIFLICFAVYFIANAYQK